MCLSLYFASAGHLPVRNHPIAGPPDFSIEELAPTAETVRQWFSLPVIRYIGTHTGCSCGFHSVVVADEPMEYWEGLFEYNDNNEEDRKRLRTAGFLIELIHQQLAATEEIQMYPVWQGDEGLPPKGTIELAASSLDPQTFFFNERFFYRVRHRAPGARVHAVTA